MINHKYGGQSVKLQERHNNKARRLRGGITKQNTMKHFEISGISFN